MASGSSHLHEYDRLCQAHLISGLIIIIKLGKQDVQITIKTTAKTP